MLFCFFKKSKSSFSCSEVWLLNLRKIRKLELKDEFELIYEKIITKFGNGAKIDAPKDLLGRKVYVVVRK